MASALLNGNTTPEAIKRASFGYLTGAVIPAGSIGRGCPGERARCGILERHSRRLEITNFVYTISIHEVLVYFRDVLRYNQIEIYPVPSTSSSWDDVQITWSTNRTKTVDT